MKGAAGHVLELHLRDEEVEALRDPLDGLQEPRVVVEAEGRPEVSEVREVGVDGERRLRRQAGDRRGLDERLKMHVRERVDGGPRHRRLRGVDHLEACVEPQRELSVGEPERRVGLDGLDRLVDVVP